MMLREVYKKIWAVHIAARLNRSEIKTVSNTKCEMFATFERLRTPKRYLRDFQMGEGVKNNIIIVKMKKKPCSRMVHWRLQIN